MLSFHSLILVAIGIITIIIVSKLIAYLRIRSKLPPGPRGLPFLGVFPQVKPKTAHLQLTEWSHEYGPIYSFFNGPKLIVVLSGVDTLKEALVKNGDVFAGRPRTHGGDLTHKNHGLINSDGPLWKEQRRFALSTLRDFGFGKPILENKISEELDYILEEIAQSNGEPTDLQFLLNNAISNVICSLVFGTRFDYEDENFSELMNHMNYLTAGSGQNIFGLPNFVPIVRYLPQAQAKMKKAVETIKEIQNFCYKMIREHEQSYSIENDPEDYIHAFMKAKDKKQGDYFYDFQLMQSIMSLFVAGTETTSTTIRWTIWFLSLNPKIQDKMRKEMSDLVGSENSPKLSDRPKLPYVEAVIMEAQRIGNLVPLSGPHRTETDVNVSGYFIPKDTLVIPLIWAAHHDPSYFPEPEKFKPERFLDVDGKLIKNDALVPFSVGKRACLGESLARMELFLFITSLVQRFKFVLPDGENKNPDFDHDRIVGVTSAPINFLVSAVDLSA